MLRSICDRPLTPGRYGSFDDSLIIRGLTITELAITEHGAGRFVSVIQAKPGGDCASQGDSSCRTPARELRRVRKIRKPYLNSCTCADPIARRNSIALRMSVSSEPSGASKS